MVDLSFVEQVTLLSTILLGFSLPAVARLTSLRDAQDITNVDNAAGVQRLFSVAVILFIISAVAMLFSTFIGLSLILILGHYPVQQSPSVARNVQDTTLTLADIWPFPLLVGLFTFMLAFCLSGWMRSRVLGVFIALVAVGMAIVGYFVFSALGPLYWSWSP